jgi:2-keto-4-pentenoate hydratase/2-oxohepta-3-ene-1,7-dioic acid hydratase in catechol pathway
MRICRFSHHSQQQVGFYDEQTIVPIAEAARAYAVATRQELKLPATTELLDFLPPAGEGFAAARQLADWTSKNTDKLPTGARLATSAVQLLVPVPRPNKLFLLAGNYAAHIEEGGGKARERQETFPYVFMKPPSTTLTNPGQPIRIPSISPSHIDWELELAVIIGRKCKGVSEAEALQYVAGYTVINDISNRKFRPNPDRKQREKDSFFDWMHGKWHDSFCPCGPCVVSADALTDPQTLPMKLAVNGAAQQEGSTSQQIFPVAAVIEFLAGFVTLEPGDIISTGTPAGVGHAKGIFLKPGDRIEATIGSIGTLSTPVEAE